MNVSRIQMFVSALLVSLISASASMAINPGRWVHTTEAAFQPGKNEGTVVTNLGDVKLSAATEVIAKMPEKADIVYDIAALKNGQT